MYLLEVWLKNDLRPFRGWKIFREWGWERVECMVYDERQEIQGTHRKDRICIHGDALLRFGWLGGAVYPDSFYIRLCCVNGSK